MPVRSIVLDPSNPFGQCLYLNEGTANRTLIACSDGKSQIRDSITLRLVAGGSFLFSPTYIPATFDKPESFSISVSIMGFGESDGAPTASISRVPPGTTPK